MRRSRVTVGAACAAVALCALAACQSAAEAGGAPGPNASSGGGAAAKPGSGAGTGMAWSYTVSSLTNNTSPDNSLSVQYPVVAYAKSTPGDAALATAMNTKLKNVDEALVSLFRSQFSAPVPVTVDGKIVPSQLQVIAHANRVGELLSVRYDAFFDRSGSASGFSEEQVLTLRADTGAVLGPADLLTPDALGGSGQSRLAALIAPSLSGDYIFGNQSAASAVNGALSTIGLPVDGMTDPVVTVTPAGLEFTFQQGALTPMSSGTPSAVVPFGQLSGLINPDALTLADSR